MFINDAADSPRFVPALPRLGQPLGMLVPPGKRRRTAGREMTMATFVLVHGGGDVGWYWHLTEAHLQARGHHTIAPDLPCDNETASLDDYAATVVEAAGGLPDLVIVGQSYGAFTATLAASQLPARLL